MTGAAGALTQIVRTKALHLALGLSVGSSALLMAGACPALGQCAGCGACLSGLPLLAVPLLVGRLRAGDEEGEQGVELADS